MNTIIILDIVSALVVIITLNLVQKHNKAWLVYAIGNFLFCPLMLYKGLYAWTIVGIILFFTGLNNYKKGRKK